jgi:(p)ppGpp synthase/HD superfamily hydrolase
MSKKQTAPLLSSKFALALQFANEIHSTQARKGAGAPYVSHLMSVSALVMEYGGNETQAIAALLHDSAEDCGGQPMLETVKVMFGEEVAQIVEACSDSLTISPDEKEDWEPRKRRYLAMLANEPEKVKLVSCADKLHNLTHTLRDIESEGIGPWKARMAATKNGVAEKQIWYYSGCFKALSQDWRNPILDEFGRAVSRLTDKLGGTS